MLAEAESHIFPGGSASCASEGWTYTEPLEPGRALISKLHHLKLQMKKTELIKQQASLQVNHFSFSKTISPCASELGGRSHARPQRLWSAPDGFGAERAGSCQLWEGKVPAEAEESGTGVAGSVAQLLGSSGGAVEEQLCAASCPGPEPWSRCGQRSAQANWAGSAPQCHSAAPKPDLTCSLPAPEQPEQGG